ncbi:MAG: NRDE family protein [Opitutales bacterium]
MTWWTGSRGTSMFFNRDEQKTRLPAEAPSPAIRKGVRFLAPRDGNFGGTWMLVNEYGLVLALLNHYPPDAPTPVDQPTSRGLLPLTLADLADTDAAGTCLRHQDLHAFRPFRLAALMPGRPLTLWTWDGRTLDGVEAPRQPVSSSSFQPAVVEAERLRAYRRIAGEDPPEPPALEAFHRQTGAWPKTDPHAICMTREDAETVSLSRVDVSENSIRFVYYPRRPAGLRRPGADPFAAPVVRTLPGVLISA